MHTSSPTADRDFEIAPGVFLSHESIVREHAEFQPDPHYYQRLTRCDLFPPELLREAARQAGRKLKRIQHAPWGSTESIRDELHAEFVNQYTWAAERAIEMSGISRHALKQSGDKPDPDESANNNEPLAAQLKKLKTRQQLDRAITRTIARFDNEPITLSREEARAARERKEAENEAWTQLSPRQQRRARRRALAAVDLHAGFTGGNSGNKRCSSAIREARGRELAKQDEFLANTLVFNIKTGESFQLQDARTQRRARLSEMYVIALGIQDQIERGKLGWLSAVATAPARMHANPEMGRNTWDGTLPNEVTTWFSEQWALARALLAKHNITLSGLWTREAHKDGCPHTNFLIAFPPEQQEKVIEVLEAVFGHSKTALEIKIGGEVEAGKKPASFASYAYKYFVKNLKEGWGHDEASDSEEATATAFGYRRFAFFGIPALSTWRQLRRLKTPPADATLLRAWEAARGIGTENGKPCASTWIEVAGGLACRRSLRPIQPLREIRTHRICTTTPWDTKTITVPAINPATGSARVDIVGVQTITMTPAGPVQTAAIYTKEPGVFTITRAPATDITPRKTLEEMKNDWERTNKALEAWRQGREPEPLVTLVYSYPRGEAPPPPETLERLPCSAREYAQANG